jgi:hypothetical protein
MCQVFAFYYPPLQALLPAPLIALFGLNTWTLRLPGALCGAAAAVLLFWTIDRGEGRNRRAALLAGVLAAAGGVVANHHYALTNGIFSLGAAICALGLARFMDSPDDTAEDRWLLVGSVGIVWAAMTLPDAYFGLPVLALAYVCRRGFRFTRSALTAAGMIILWTVVYGVFWFWLPRCWQEDVGSRSKVQAILSQLGAFRVQDLMMSFAAASSWPMLILAPILLPLGWTQAARGLRWVVGVYVFPLLLWTFAFDYPNVRASHMLVAFPAYAMLWSLGAFRLFDLSRTHSSWISAAAAVVLAATVLSALWQASVLHVADIVPEERRGPSWLVLKGYYPQGRCVDVLGQPAAGWWVRSHSETNAGVCSNLGGAFSDYYAARPHCPLSRLPELAHDAEAARGSGVRFYAHSLETGQPPETALDELPVALEVRHRNQTILRLYDLWRECRETEVLDASEGRLLWNQRVSSDSRSLHP